MVKKDESETIEDQAQISVLKEFAPAVREIVRCYRNERQLSSTPRKLGFRQSRLTEMITKKENGEYKKRIIPCCLERLIYSCLIDARQFLAGRDTDEIPDRARLGLYWNRHSQWMRMNSS